MKQYFNKFTLYLFIILVVFACQLKEKEMKWFTKEEEYEGDPLYLRRPDYNDICRYKEKYTKLLCLTHSLDSVKSNGLPTSDYNESLIDFDGEAIDLLDEKDEGIVFLIETYGGARNYWFYCSPSVDLTTKFNKFKLNHSDKKLEFTLRSDKDWGFIEQYPYKLYTK